MLAPRVQALPDSGKHGEGIVVGLLDKGQRVISRGGVDVDDVFEIGSITKVFTASLLADMVARGEARLDDPVANYLPRAVRMPVRGRPVTLLDLATQPSGLPRMPDNFSQRDSSNPYADYSVQQLYEFLSRYQLPRDPGAAYEYSNLGMGLLGHALALKAGMSYEQLVTHRILRPLGMKETSITLTKGLDARLAPGHDGEGHVVHNWDLPTLAGAGALRSTATDLITFMVANLDSTATPLSRTLYQTHGERQATNDPNLKIGLAWHILSRPVGKIVWHNGGTGGYRSFIGFDPVRRIGVVVLCNNGNENVDDIGFHLLDETFPLKSPPPRRTEVAVDSMGVGSLRGRLRADAGLSHRRHAPGGPFVRAGNRAAAVCNLCGVGLDVLSQGGGRPAHVQAGRAGAASERPARTGPQGALDSRRCNGASD